MKLKLLFILSLIHALVLQGAAVGNDFDKHFIIELPESYALSFSGGKKGEKQFSIYDDRRNFMTSIFVYYGGLDPRKWKGKHDKEAGEFLHVSGDFFVWAKLPENLNLNARETVWDILSSIERKLQPVDTANASNAASVNLNQSARIR
jgi:hypothetical protein